jgi:RNA-directed DNA polymerase
MPVPSPQRYASGGRRQGIDSQTLDNAIAAITRIRATDPRITPVLTLRHLSVLTELPFLFLRRTVARQERVGYRTIFLKKRIPGRSSMRRISIPPKSLAHVQNWLVQNVLQYTSAHPASFAFHPDSSPILAAEQHPNTKWLLKVDIQDFFHSISEGTVASIFSRLGFPKLLAFELGRLCTIPCNRGPSRNPKPHPSPIEFYRSDFEGYLPQGAATSPMLANLAMSMTDQRLSALAEKFGFRYSRYADDLAFSSPNDHALVDLQKLKRNVFHILNSSGFRPNLRKTVVRGPGARRIVLGMLVDGKEPRLSKEFKDSIRLHLYYLTSPQHGPQKHALSRKTGVSSMYHHVRGLIAWARQVEKTYGEEALAKFKSVNWPPIQPRMVHCSLDDLMDKDD